MLPQTKRAVESLKDAGLSRKQFRIKTPWKQSVNGYGDTTIVILCSYAQLAPFVQKLTKHFKVVVTLLDGIPCDVSVKIADAPGLYKFENGQEIEVSQIEYNGEYQQSVIVGERV